MRLHLVARSILPVLLIGTCWLSLPSSTLGQEQGDRKAASEDASGTLKKAQVIPNFNVELQSSFASLRDLGHRIRVARDAKDPVSLASASHELGVAEKVSGKKASLTAEALAEEAAELARLRFDAKELQAVALLTGKTELDSIAKQAAEAAAEEEAASARGEKPRGITTLEVYNSNAFFDVDIYVNGNYVGQVGNKAWGSFDLTRFTRRGQSVQLEAVDKTGDSWNQAVPFDKPRHQWVLPRSCF